MNILKFLATPSFNWIDIVIFAWAVAAIEEQLYITCSIIIIGGSIFNVTAQRTLGVLNEKPKS